MGEPKVHRSCAPGVRATDLELGEALTHEGQRIRNSVTQSPALVIWRTLKRKRCLVNKNSLSCPLQEPSKRLADHPKKKQAVHKYVYILHVYIHHYLNICMWGSYTSTNICIYVLFTCVWKQTILLVFFS